MSGARKPVIVVHGGAAAHLMVRQDKTPKSDVNGGVISAASMGYNILLEGGSAVDAVQAAVVNMEDNPVLNCGYGSFLTSERTIEMDASIMNGADLSAGAVASITNIKNPVLVARTVMDQTPHVLFCGEAATKLAESRGFKKVSYESLITDKALNRLSEQESVHLAAKVTMPMQKHADDHDTVGAVALDQHGNVACATSTGGISGKMCGRVGDSPLIGCGGYADNQGGAVATTGDGEAFMKMCTSKYVGMLLEQGDHPQAAVESALSRLTSRLKSSGGGCIAVNREGEVGIHFTTDGMAWAVIKDNNVQYGLYKDEQCTEEYVSQ